MEASLETYPTLVLNADYRPLSYFPLSLWSWQETVKAVFLDRVNILSEYDRQVHSPSWAFSLPSVISLKQYIPATKRPAFTRFNVFLRDRFACQYCGHDFTANDLTFDHVLPRSRGGHTTWENVVAACRKCNTKKGGRLLKETRMRLLTRPRRPRSSPLLHEKIDSIRYEIWRHFLSENDYAVDTG